MMGIRNRRTNGVFKTAMLCAMIGGAGSAWGARDLDLADIVGGGDGTGTGVVQGIHPVTGAVSTTHLGSITVFGGQVNVTTPVANPYIDAVFAPDGGLGGSASIPVSTTGTSVTGISDSSGAETWDLIWANENPTGVTTTLTFGSFLGVHANKGITFDLDAIELDNPGYQATQFSVDAAFGGTTAGDVDFYVVVDGTIIEQTNITGSTGSNSKVPLGATLGTDDRFLTLITSANGRFFNDWSFFGDPTLTLDKTSSPPPTIVPTPGAAAAGLFMLGLLSARRRRCTPVID